MKKTLFIAALVILFGSAEVEAQMERPVHPISTARIVGLDGKTALLFDEAINDAFTVNVLDLTGKSMFMLRHRSSDDSCEEIDLPIAGLRKGIYLVQVIGEDGKTKTLKLQRN